MMTRHFLCISATLCLGVILLVSCSRSPRITFYTLNPVATAESTTTPVSSVSVGPVTLPDLLDRPQLVVRTSPNQVDIIESHRWAESLKSEIPRIIAGNMALLLKPARVSASSQGGGLEAEYRILIDIQRLDMTDGEGVILDALWTVRRAAGGEPKAGRFVISERAPTAGYEALVAAQSRALASFSRDLASVLRSEAASPR